MAKIKNSNYRRFLDEGLIKTLEEEDIKAALDNIKGKNKAEGRSLLIALYYTGARPNEILRLTPRAIIKEKNYIRLLVPGSKRGTPRTIYLPYKHQLVKELYKYSKSLFPDQVLFYHYQNHYTRTTTNKAGETKTTTTITDKLRYYIKKWFKGVLDINPYYLRHNRFSKLTIKGATDRELMQLKGSKTIESIRPYQHLSKHSAIKIARKID